MPKVTIDFGDGHRVERTITGNSLHYVLDGRGRLVLVLPGLMGPTTFRRALESLVTYAAADSTALGDRAQERWAQEAWRLRLARRAIDLANARADVEDRPSRWAIDLEELTDWIYPEVFRTPLDDPFLGLAPEDVYAALPAPGPPP